MRSCWLHSVKKTNYSCRKRSSRAPGALIFFNDTATTEIYTLSLHDALPIYWQTVQWIAGGILALAWFSRIVERSEEHTSELQSLRHLVCRLLLEKKTTA